ncbi:hypothetical protein EBT16_09115 [bacterium]|nr:hypothetical protein [bacterium]
MQANEKLERIAVALEEIKELLKEIKPRTRKEAVKSEPCPLKDLWNKFAHEKMPRVLNVSHGSTRDRNAKARWKENSSDGYWTSVILRLNRSSFALGGNDKAWVADFDFFVRPDVHNRIMEGKYDDRNLMQKRFVGYTAETNLPVYETVKK